MAGFRHAFRCIHLVSGSGSLVLIVHGPIYKNFFKTVDQDPRLKIKRVQNKHLHTFYLSLSPLLDCKFLLM